MGSHKKSDARIGAGDGGTSGNTTREAAPCGSNQTSWTQQERKKTKEKNKQRSFHD
jgi:hypothetical protein